MGEQIKPPPKPWRQNRKCNISAFCQIPQSFVALVEFALHTQITFLADLPQQRFRLRSFELSNAHLGNA
jgi:hypothetical protein